MSIQTKEDYLREEMRFLSNIVGDLLQRVKELEATIKKNDTNK